MKDDKFLFLIFIGGRAPKANIELHDVRWEVGSKIEDTFDSLRNNWFGSPNGLHIDSYKKIEWVDGYKINLRRIKKDSTKKINFNNNEKNKNKLWFVNLGGYERDSMQERHEFGFVVAKNSQDAKKIAKSKWLLGYRKTHQDNLSLVEKISDVDDCEVIKNLDHWEIDLKLEDELNDQDNSPDWFGYMKLD